LLFKGIYVILYVDSLLSKGYRRKDGCITMKRILSLTLAFILTASFLPVAVPGASASSGFGFGPNGNFLAPIQPPVPGSVAISTRAGLEAIRNWPGSTYHLVNDINLSGAEWTPIFGAGGAAFTGIFDGQGFVIRNMTITGGGGVLQHQDNGLFGFTQNAVIRNVGLENAAININPLNPGTYSAGGISGYNIGGVFSNCYTAGQVSVRVNTGNGFNNNIAYAGGLVGLNQGGTINDSYNTASVNAQADRAAYAGGLLGGGGLVQNDGVDNIGFGASGMSIDRCFNTGSIQSFTGWSSGFAGGIGGVIHASVSDCYNTGAVSAYGTSDFPNAGGIAGSSMGTVTNVYSSGNLATSHGRLGGIAALNSGVISNAYWNIDRTFARNGTNLTNAQKRAIWDIAAPPPTVRSLTSAQMQQQASFAGFNFNTVWTTHAATNNGFPIFRGQRLTVNFVPVTGITGVPTTATVGVPLALSGIVAPTNATNRNIVWSLVNPVLPGATITGNILNTTGPGVLTVRATIIDGTSASPSVNFEREFNITVSMVPVTGITGVPTSAVVDIPLILTGTVAPANATNRAINWSIVNWGTTDAQIISGNTLISTKPGTLIVRATILHGTALGVSFVRDFSITVITRAAGFVPVVSIISVPATASVDVPLALSGTVTPSNATNQMIIWAPHPENTTPVEFNGNTMIPKAAGTVIVRATILYGLSPLPQWPDDPPFANFTQDFSISVVFVPVESITGVPAAANVGVPLTLFGTVNPGTATNKDITWSVVNAGTTGASVSGNVLNTTAPGTVTVQARVANGLAAGDFVSPVFSIVVTHGALIPVSTITNIPSQATVGIPLTLTGTVNPANASNKVVTWLVVNAGTTGAVIVGDSLIASAVGPVSVQAVIANGTAVGVNYTQSVTIQVTALVPATDITGVPATTNAGASVALNGTVLPAEASNRNIIWSINNPGTTGASIAGNVLLTASAGTVSVLATIPNGTAVGLNYTKTFVITVSAQSSGGTVPGVGFAPGYMTASPWAVGHINEAYNKGFIPVGLQGNYSTAITRGEFAILAMSWLNYYTGKTDDELLAERGLTRMVFNDTDSRIIGAAGALGVTAGVGGNSFAPGMPFDRQQAAVMLMNVIRVINPTQLGASFPQYFSDEASAALWSREALRFVGHYGYMSGTSTSGNIFSPGGTFTRQEAIIVFNKMG
jgi:hypothetical protein